MCDLWRSLLTTAVDKSRRTQPRCSLSRAANRSPPYIRRRARKEPKRAVRFEAARGGGGGGARGVRRPLEAKGPMWAVGEAEQVAMERAVFIDFGR
ncbi:hypothetical protein BaRGS_00037378, partial [Batillaria attramentaria]